MQIDIMIVSYLQGGGASPYSYVDDLLNARLKKNYGSAVKSIEIYPRLHVPKQLRPKSYEYFDDWQIALEKLPFIAFRRNLKRIELAFCSKHFDLADMNIWWKNAANGNKKFPVEAISLAGNEIKEALQLIRKRVKSSDDFDFVRFLTDVEAAFNSAPRSVREWDELAKKPEKEHKELRTKQDPWEQLDIDWSEYHSSAKKILDDSFYWDCVDELAPHGNDTGADLLEDFMKWNRRNPKKSSMTFLENLFTKMLIEPIDWSLTKKDEVLKLDQDLPVEMEICNEAAIALAFAVVKLRGRCPTEVVNLANCALDRTAIIVRAKRLGRKDKARILNDLKRMKTKLESVPR